MLAMAGEEVHHDHHHQDYINSYEDHYLHDVSSCNGADSDDADETLSLSDLPLYSSSSSCSKDFDWSSLSEDSTTYQDDEEDVFEFFSGDTLASALSFQEKNIIFCGKLIACNDGDGDENQITSTCKQQQQPTKNENKKKSTLSLFSSRKNTNAMILPVSSDTCNDGKLEKYDVVKHQVNKLSILRSPTKSRWQIFMLGNLFKLPLDGEMDLNDMKSRRRRRSPPPPRAVEKLWSFDGGDEKEESERGQGIWKMVKTKVLGSGISGHHQNDDVVKGSSSIGCVPLW